MHAGGNAHLWEESWDDDDPNEDFSKQLKWVNELMVQSFCGMNTNQLAFYREELKKVEGNKGTSS
jgi:hypothetical protein